MLGLRSRKKPLVCVHCGQEITRGQEIREFRGFKWRSYHETCAAEAGLIDEDEFGWPLRGPENAETATSSRGFRQGTFPHAGPSESSYSTHSLGAVCVALSGRLCEFRRVFLRVVPSRSWARHKEAAG